MVGNEYIGVDAEYLKELEEKAKKSDFFEGYIKGVEVAFAFAEEIAKFAKTERTITIPKAHGRKQALQMIDNIEALADRKTEPFDKDINVRSKDEPQTDCKTCRHWRCNYEECGEIECKYEPKDEPQERSE